MTQPPQSSSPQPPSPAQLDSGAVENYLNILQNVIARMANNSSNCKTWCVTIVSALLVVLVDKEKAQYGLIVLIPIALFCFLDAYYLGLERAFRDTYNSFVKRLHEKTALTSDIYKVIPQYKMEPPKAFSIVQVTLEALGSFAVYPFYGTLFLATIAYVLAVG